MATVDVIKAVITADDSGFQQAVKRTTDGVNKSSADFAKMAKGMAAVGAAAAAAAGAVLKLANDGLQLADQSVKTARSLGATSGELEKLRFAAQQSGVATGTLDSSLKLFNVRVGEAIQGTGTAAQAFQRLGIDARNLASLPLDERMGVIADALQGVENATQRAQLSYQIFGRQGVELTKMLEGGSAALREAAQESERFGIVLDTRQTAAIEAATDAQGRMATSLKGLKMQLSAELAPALEQSADRVANWTASFTQAMPAIVAVARSVLGLRRELDQLSVSQLEAEMKRLEFFKRMPALRVFFSVDVSDFDEKMEDLRERRDKLAEEMSAAINLPEVDFGETTKSLDDAAKLAASIFAGTRTEVENLQQRIMQTKDLIDAGVFDRLGLDGLEALQRLDEELGAVMQRQADREAQEQERLNERLDNQVQSVRQHLMTREELEYEALQRRIQSLQEAHDAERLSLEEFQQLKEDLEADHLQRLADIRERESEREAERKRREQDRELVGMRNYFNQALSASAQGNKKMFEISKLASIAQALVKAREAVASAYAWGARIGGPPLGAAAAAAAGAAGALHVSAIRAQQFSAGGIEAASPAGGMVTPMAAAPAQPQQTLTVRGIDANTLIAGADVRILAERLLDYQRDGGRVVFA